MSEFNIDDFIISGTGFADESIEDLLCNEGQDKQIIPEYVLILAKINEAKQRRADHYKQRKNLRFKSNDLSLKILEVSNELCVLRAEYLAALKAARVNKS